MKKHIVLVAVGVLLAVGGLVALTLRNELVGAIFGSARIMKEMWSGGDDVKNTLLGFMIGGIASLILGILATVFGLFGYFQARRPHVSG